MSALGNDMGRYMQYKAAESMPDAAKQPGGAAGTGMGLGMGFGMGQVMANAFGGGQGQQGGQQQQGGGGAQSVPCPKCGTPNQPGVKFCNNCGANVQQQAAATVPCPNCQA